MCLATPRIVWPDGKDFAFTAFDDTDLSTVENTRPVYDLLAELGFRTTKSAWPLRPEDPALGDGDGMTCEDEFYLRWLRELQSQGFEIGLHLVASRTSRREWTRRGLERFRELFGPEPITLANHLTNAEGIYYGTARLTGPRRLAYAGYARLKKLHQDSFRGHVEGDELFWGDLCREFVKYVRNLTFPDINTLNVCPFMPYYDPVKPYVRSWFVSSEAGDLGDCLKLLGEANQDRLAAEGGACILYTHFAFGFAEDGRPEPRFERLLRRLAGMNGWFVPVRTLLDYLTAAHGPHRITRRERSRLEWSWLRHKARTGRS
jgi:hypothetical protein